MEVTYEKIKHQRFLILEKENRKPLRTEVEEGITIPLIYTTEKKAKDVVDYINNANYDDLCGNNK